MSTNAPTIWIEGDGGVAVDGRIATCRRHAPRYHLSNGRRQMIVLLMLAVLFILTATLPTVMGNQRSYSSAGGIEPTASNASDGTVNSTKTQVYCSISTSTEPPHLMMCPMIAVPNGTASQVKCNEGYHVPAHLQPATYFSCNEGQWNNTMRPFCYKPTPFPPLTHC